jgi:hypothetical protein
LQSTLLAIKAKSFSVENYMILLFFVTMDSEESKEPAGNVARLSCGHNGQEEGIGCWGDFRRVHQGEVDVVEVLFPQVIGG